MMETVNKLMFCLVVAPAIVLLILLDMTMNPSDYPSDLTD